MKTRRSLLLAATLAALAVLAACGTPVKKLPAAPAPVAGSAPGPAYGKAGSGEFVWSSRMDAARSQLADSLRGQGVQVARTDDERLWLSLPGDLCFEPNRSALKPAARGLLDQVVLALRGNPRAELRIVGHTDTKGAAAANNALSLDRAASTRDWFVARGLSPVRIAVAGRGAADPVAGNSDEAGRAANRRVEIIVGERR